LSIIVVSRWSPLAVAVRGPVNGAHPASVRVHHGTKTPNPPTAIAVTADAPCPATKITHALDRAARSQARARARCGSQTSLPQIAADFHTTVGSAALVVSAVIAHGSISW
jgi:hypothetical protein